MVGHNWIELFGSVKSAEKRLKGFKYKGPGWYETATDTLLVQTFETEGTKFRAHKKGPGLRITCWNQLGGRQIVVDEFAAVMKMDVFRPGSRRVL